MHSLPNRRTKNPQNFLHTHMYEFIHTHIERDRESEREWERNRERERDTVMGKVKFQSLIQSKQKLRKKQKRERGKEWIELWKDRKWQFYAFQSYWPTKTKKKRDYFLVFTISNIFQLYSSNFFRKFAINSNFCIWTFNILEKYIEIEMPYQGINSRMFFFQIHKNL